ncbi:hypothetical protein V6N13_095037 [Hibiscus sabdariffa]|uniref:2Fe-2S ferredoxin-type domain-containing protein n=1 Tax=Hibiscus sabdariffa TaxID=183260 RepID=A0ABR2PSU0_9ROSI
MVFLPQLLMVLLQEGMKREKRYLSHLFARMEKKSPFKSMRRFTRLFNMPCRSDEDPADEENDMLDLAFGLTETSRLGCQIVASPELDGIRLAIPSATRNFAVDGYVAKPH